MAEENIRWFNVDKIGATKDCSFEDERLISCQLTKIFHYSEKRNAYWNTTSNLWPGDRAFHYDLDVIKKRIENDRKKGSYFSIYEIPCLAIKGLDDCIVLINSHPQSKMPFRGFQNIEALDFPNANIKEIFDYLNSKYSFYGFVMESIQVPNFETPLYRHTSHSSGPNYYLNYTEHMVRFDIQYLLKAFQLFHKYFESE